MIKKFKSSYDKALAAAKSASSKKGHDIVLLDMRKQSSVCDWFVIMSAGSTRRIKTICSEIEYVCKQKGSLALSIEGRQNANWMLMDYGDIVIHVFHETIRKFYDLENLWADAPKHIYKETCSAKIQKKVSKK